MSAAESDEEKVQNLILQCIRKHKTKKETEELLFQNHNIEHTITGRVWELMEAKNEGFFKSYSGLLTTKETFNSLFAQQAALLGIAPPSSSRGGPAQGNQSVGGAASLFGQSSASLVSSSSTSNPFASKPSGFSSSGFGSTVSSHAFTYIQSLTPSSPFGSTSSTSSLFSSQNPAFTPSMFSTTGSSTFGLSNSLFGTSLAQGTTNTFGLSPNFSNSQSLPFFQSSTPSMPPSSSPFGQSMLSLGQTTSPFSQNAFNPPSSGFGGNMFASILSLGQRNIMRDPELEKTRFAEGKQILNEDNGNGSKTTHLMSRRDDRGLKFISQLNKCNLAASVSRENAPSVKVEVKVSLLPLGFMIGGSIVLIGAAGLFLMSQKCDNLISEIKLFREGILLEGRLTRSDIKAILDRWADAGYPPLASLFSLSF